MSLKHESDKVIVFERGELLWIFNFHPTQGYTDYRIGTPWHNKHHLVLSSDSEEFGGHSRVDRNGDYFPVNERWHNRDCYVQVFSCFCIIDDVEGVCSSKMCHCTLSLKCEGKKTDGVFSGGDVIFYEYNLYNVYTTFT